MRLTVQRSKIRGAVEAPASKSHAQRVLAAALLAPGTSHITRPSRSEDALAATGIIQQLGAKIEDQGNKLIIKGGFRPAGNRLDCGEAGLSLRMFAPIAALSDETMILSGSGSLLKRPVGMITEALAQFGVRCQSQDGFVPVWIRGPLKSGRAVIDGSVSSQVLTGILMALPVVRGDSEVRVADLQSKPYIDLTLKVLRDFGIKVEHEAYSLFRIPGRQKYRAAEVAVEGDWSGASFLLVAGALAGTVTVTRLDPGSTQADRQILTALERAGATVVTSEDGVTVTRNELRAFDFDATHCPDLFPPLVALATHCQGVTRIGGAQRLIHKESNRARVLQEEFHKIGVSVKTDGSSLYVTGPALMRTGEMDSNNDHRIAMAAATVATASRTPVKINGTECVAKSYPNFFTDLKSIGGRIDE
ncbi:MAG: 3-phosphoshikimate 1-carboxyvinyltransferase [Bacteroidales bacterium]